MCGIEFLDHLAVWRDFGGEFAEDYRESVGLGGWVEGDEGGFQQQAGELGSGGGDAGGCGEGVV